MNKIQSPKNDKPAVLGFIDSKKLISRNIWVAEKRWNVHTVEKDQLWQSSDTLLFALEISEDFH